MEMERFARLHHTDLLPLGGVRVFSLNDPFTTYEPNPLLKLLTNLEDLTVSHNDFSSSLAGFVDMLTMQTDAPDSHFCMPKLKRVILEGYTFQRDYARGYGNVSLVRVRCTVGERQAAR